MKGLTAKVFRTFNASMTFQDLLDRGTPEKGTVQEKLNAYNHANRMVAIASLSIDFWVYALPSATR